MAFPRLRWNMRIVETFSNSPLEVGLRIFGKEFSSGQVSFLSGCALLFTYVTCIVVPHHFQGYATMPLTWETAHNPSGLPAFPLIRLFVYILSIPWFGACWLLLSGILVGCGCISESKSVDRAIRIILLLVHFFLVCNLTSYARIALVLDT